MMLSSTRVFFTDDQRGKWFRRASKSGLGAACAHKYQIKRQFCVTAHFVCKCASASERARDAPIPFICPCICGSVDIAAVTEIMPPDARRLARYLSLSRAERQDTRRSHAHVHSTGRRFERMTLDLFILARARRHAENTHLCMHANTCNPARDIHIDLLAGKTWERERQKCEYAQFTNTRHTRKFTSKNTPVCLFYNSFLLIVYKIVKTFIILNICNF